VATAAAAPAAEDTAGTVIVGTLTAPDGSPVSGVVITVSADGFTQSGTSGADGTFNIPLPKGGTYLVEIDETTLPEGLALAKADDASRELLVLGGEKKIIVKLSAGGGAGSGDTESTESSEGGSASPAVLQLLVDGILLGILIALGALGLNLIFGTTGLTNFSQGELLTLGAFTALMINGLLVGVVVPGLAAALGLDADGLTGLEVGAGILAAVLAVVVSAVLFGWFQNAVLWRPLRRRRTGLIASMIVTIGLAITLRYTILLIFGGSPRSYPQFAGQTGLEVLGVSITPKSIVLAVLAIAAITVTVLWLQNSRIGKATRAVSDNPALASATGIDVERVISVVWTLGAGLAAFAGIYLGITQDISWNMGQRLLLVMFAAVTLGGLGTIYGAIVGALVVGVFIQLTTLVIPTEMKTVGALFLMIIILLVRPQGILGRRERVG
jgi:branched-chain amino acid transport system permease protein